MVKCPVLNCEIKSTTYRRFPSHKNQKKRFKLWLLSTKNRKLFNLTCKQIWTNCRFCDEHFDNTYKTSKKLDCRALPEYYLPTINDETFEADVDQYLETFCVCNGISNDNRDNSTS